MYAFSVAINADVAKLRQATDTLIGLGFKYQNYMLDVEVEIIDVYTKGKTFVCAAAPYTLLIKPDDIEDVLMLEALGTELETLMNLYHIKE